MPVKATTGTLYNVFATASVLLVYIGEEAAQLPVAIPRPPIEGSPSLPYVSTLTHPYGSSIDSQIFMQFPSIVPDRHGYFADTTHGAIIVKFTPRYSHELHTFCTDRGLAPKLLGFERPPGGFFGVAIECFQSASPITNWVSDPTKLSRWTAQLRELVADCHAKGLVHGDLRSPNIRSDGDKVMLIGFDSD